MKYSYESVYFEPMTFVKEEKKYYRVFYKGDNEQIGLVLYWEKEKQWGVRCFDVLMGARVLRDIIAFLDTLNGQEAKDV